MRNETSRTAVHSIASHGRALKRSEKQSGKHPRVFAGGLTADRVTAQRAYRKDVHSIEWHSGALEGSAAQCSGKQSGLRLTV